MNPKLKRILSALAIILSIAAVIAIAFGNTELKNAWDTIRHLDVAWLAGLLLCWFCYTFFDALGSWFCLRKQGFHLSPFTVLGTTLIGFYYSNITPGASGGQPMQVNALRQKGIPVGNGTTVVTVRLIFNQFMVSVLSLVLFLLNRDFVYRELEGAIWFVRVGWLINFAVVPIVLLAAFRKDWIQPLVHKLIALGVKIHLVRNQEAADRKADEVLDTYYTTFNDLLRSPLQILMQCVFSGLSLTALMATIIFVYYAFGLSGTLWRHLLTLSFLLFVSASYTPLPGASGAQEGGFLYFFRNIFTGGTAGLALLVWRFFTFYLFIFVGAALVLLDKLTHRRQKKELKPVPEPDD